MSFSLRMLCVCGVSIAVISMSAGCPGLRFTLEPKTSLSEDEVAALDQAMRQFQALARVLGGLHGVLSGIEASAADVAPAAASCPSVSVDVMDGLTAVVLDYGNTDCVSDALGRLPVSGRVTYQFDESSRTGTIHFDSFTIDGHQVVGGATLGYAFTEADVLELAGALEINTLDRGIAVGVVTVAYERNSLLTIANGVWRFSPLDFDVEVIHPGDDGTTDIVIDPSGNPEFIPQAGQLSFWMSNSTRLEVEFDSSSPTTHRANVIWNNTETFTYQIPG